MNYAWPTAEIAVMGASGATAIVFRREKAAAQAVMSDPNATPEVGLSSIVSTATNRLSPLSLSASGGCCGGRVLFIYHRERFVMAVAVAP